MTDRAVWTIDDAERALFAELSGDVNPIHADPILARRELAGAVVLHGAHLVLKCLDREVAEGRLRQIPSSVGITFLRGVRPSTPLTSEWSRDSAHLTVQIAENGSPVARIDLAFHAGVERSAPARLGRPPPETADDLEASELAGLTGRLDIRWDDDAATRLFPHAQVLLGEQRTAEFASISRIVGMKAPGRRSMSSRYDVGFEAGPHGADLHYEVSGVDERIAKVDLRIVGSTLTAHVTAFRTPDPVDQRTQVVRVEPVARDDLAGERVLVVGGSRGLGAAFALLAAHAGADVVVTYRVGERDAGEIAMACGGAAVGFDATVPDSVVDHLPDGWSPTVLIWCATPHLGSLDLTSDREIAAQIQIDALERSVDDLRGLRAVIWPSIDADEREGDELIALKRRGEDRLTDLASSRPDLAISTPRLPPLVTDQTMTLFPTERADTTAELAPVLGAALSAHTYTRRVQTDPLIDVFADGLGLDAETLSDDTSPDNTPEWDSLAAMTLVSLVEDRFKVRLSTRDIMKMQTIGLARTVLQGKGVDGI